MDMRCNENESKISIESWGSKCIKGLEEEQDQYGL